MRVMSGATGRLMAVDPRQIAAVLFDLDGTLVDSRVVIEQTWTAWCDEYDVELARALPATHGVSAAETIRILLPRETDAVFLRAVERHAALELQFESGVRVAPGAIELLGLLRVLELPWAVVTSAGLRTARGRLQRAGISPSVLVTIDDVTAGKPEPEGYLQAASRIGVVPARCLVVEDSGVGIAAGRAAGAPVAALNAIGGDLPIADLASLADWLRSPHAHTYPSR